ncbi:transposase [Methylobacterium fujisawaense]|uniref:transposase n=1 Tax=Methylobacterium fujisawaense TaxID=107400 RepID=UPI00313E3224
MGYASSWLQSLKSWSLRKSRGGSPLPARFAGIILAFAPLFVHRSWRHAQLLLIGAILMPGCRTVTRVLSITGRARERRFVNVHRILNRAAWCPRSGSRILLGLLVDVFAQRGPVDLGLDDTIERRCGKRIAAKGIFREPGCNVAQKAGPNRRMRDVSPGEIRRQWTYKAGWTGRVVLAVPPAYTRAGPAPLETGYRVARWWVKELTHAFTPVCGPTRACRGCRGGGCLLPSRRSPLRGQRFEC